MLTLLFNNVAVAPSPLELAPGSGVYAMPVAVSVTVPEGVVAVYTLDGAEPTAGSQQFDGQPITVQQTTMIRVATMDAGILTGESVAALYKNIAEADMVAAAQLLGLFVRSSGVGIAGFRRVAG